MMLDNEIWLPLSLDERESAPPEQRWKFDLKWEKSGKGAIKVAGTINNIIAILTNDPLLQGKIRHNDFSTVIDVRDVLGRRRWLPGTTPVMPTSPAILKATAWAASPTRRLPRL